MGKKFDAFHKHEALDRCHLLINTVDAELLQLQWVQAHKSVKKQIKKSVVRLSRAYQLIGSTK